MRRALLEWGRAARCSDQLADGMGSVRAQDLLDQCHGLRECIHVHENLIEQTWAAVNQRVMSRLGLGRGGGHALEPADESRRAGIWKLTEMRRRLAEAGLEISTARCSRCGRERRRLPASMTWTSSARCWSAPRRTRCPAAHADFVAPQRPGGRDSRYAALVSGRDRAAPRHSEHRRWTGWAMRPGPAGCARSPTSRSANWCGSPWRQSRRTPPTGRRGRWPVGPGCRSRRCHGSGGRSASSHTAPSV